MSERSAPLGAGYRREPGKGTLVITNREWVNFQIAVGAHPNVSACYFLLFGVALFNLFAPLTGEALLPDPS